ncbi:protein ERP2 [Strigomonas culicis]|nr:protein ERP2 [Strigomonas culicis]|eukprot:EPY37034.1 protein ERP2 [Strigomonas culicis]
MVVAGGAQDIDVSIRGPDENLVWESTAESENRVFFKPHNQGIFTFCFSNRISTFTPKVVSFMIAIGAAEGKVSGKAADGSAGNGLLKRDKLTRLIVRIGQGVDEVEELQDYLAIREKRHRSTVEVANTRVVVFAFLEVVIVVGMCAANIVFIRRMFKMKRMV